MKQSQKTLLFWVLVILMCIVIFNFVAREEQPRSVPFSEFVTDVSADKVQKVKIRPQANSGEYTYWLKSPDESVQQGQRGVRSEKVTIGIMGEQINKQLLDHGVSVEYLPEDENSLWTSILVTWLPMIFLVGILLFFMRQLQASGGKAMSFGKSRARLLNESQNKVTFKDVAGIDEAKDDCEEIIAFLKDPKKFQRLGGRIPKGVLLMGAPGTGKTLLARAIAGEAGVPFFSISGSDFVEMFVGVGASRVRDLFEQGKKNAPCIIFIDEIDAVGRHRGAGLGGGHDEREQTLNQLLVEMDGFEANEGVILIAATNRPDVLDPALLRPGRFDRQIVVPNPDVVGREQILKVHMRNVPVAPDIDARVLARGTPGFSGADLANLVNEAALLAARRNKRIVTQHEFEDAKDKVMMGAERRSLVMSDEERRNTAYHEAGHAIVGLAVPYDPLHKVTIIPRGRALGVTMNLPEGDRHSRTREWCEARLAVLFGGREAELLLGGEKNVTNGAMGDIQMATQLARAMIMEWGMSDKLGRVRYNGNEQEVFLGHSVTQTKNISDETAKLIDQEIRDLIANGEATAKRVLSDKPEQLHRLAAALLELETLSGDEVKRVLAGETITRDDNTRTPKPDKPASSVPSAGGAKRGHGGTGELEPQPQA